MLIKKYSTCLLLVVSLVSSLCLSANTSTFCLGAPCNADANQLVSQNKTRTLQDFNFNWKFALNDESAYAMSDFEDTDWQDIRLPHDWSIKQPFDKALNGATAYLPGGIGWYRKTFKHSFDHAHQSVYLYFDGIYNHSEVWLNNKKIGGRINGYTPFYIDVSTYLNSDGSENVLAIRVDRSRYIDSRWYSGSGIYRDVKLLTVNKVHVPIWGNFITTPEVSAKRGVAEFEVSVKNASSKDKQIQVELAVETLAGKVIKSKRKRLTIGAGQTGAHSQKLKVKKPKLWGINEPNLYLARVTLYEDGKVLDQHTSKFGFRDIKYDANTGFYLNGKNTEIKGVNLHHAAGSLGSAVPDDVWKRRLSVLREAGVNAIRTAHKPMSDRFMDLCDEMGFLVQVEIFDEWDNPKDKRLNQWERHSDYISRGYSDYFQEEAHGDLINTVLRDRSRPSVIMWSIGNEIEWTYPRYKAATGYFDMDASGNYFFNPPFISPQEIKDRFHTSEEGEYVLANTAKKLSNWVKELDVSRPVTANLILPSVSHISGYTDALDVVGYSYRRVIYDYGHKLFPEKMIMGTENVVQWHEWKAVQERPFIPGTFLWTGADYLGESNGGWPRKAVQSGMVDTASFKKPSYHMMKTLWDSESHIALFTQTAEKSQYQVDANTNKVVEKKEGAWANRVWYWYDVNEHWNYADGEPIIVEAISNCANVELFLNGASMGVQSLADYPDRIMKWAVPFTSGRLEAKGVGACATGDAISTAGAAKNIRLTVDQLRLAEDGYSIAHIVAELLDESGVLVQTDDKEVRIELPEGFELVGADNGSTSKMEQYFSPSLLTHNGKALFVVRRSYQSGVSEKEIHVNSLDKGVSGAKLTIGL